MRPISVVLIMIAMTSGAAAQAMKPHPPAGTPDPYRNSFNFAGINCCHGQDCQQAINSSDFKPVEGGYLIKPTGEIVRMFQTGFSPDAFWHICRKAEAPHAVRCLLIPPGGA